MSTTDRVLPFASANGSPSTGANTTPRRNGPSPWPDTYTAGTATNSGVCVADAWALRALRQPLRPLSSRTALGPHRRTRLRQPRTGLGCLAGSGRPATRHA